MCMNRDFYKKEFDDTKIIKTNLKTKTNEK